MYFDIVFFSTIWNVLFESHHVLYYFLNIYIYIFIHEEKFYKLMWKHEHLFIFEFYFEESSFSLFSTCNQVSFIHAYLHYRYLFVLFFFLFLKKIFLRRSKIESCFRFTEIRAFGPTLLMLMPTLLFLFYLSWICLRLVRLVLQAQDTLCSILPST